LVCSHNPVYAWCASWLRTELRVTRDRARAFGVEDTLARLDEPVHGVT